MAHFAKLGKGNIVEKVLVVSNDDIATTEQAGIDFLNQFIIKQMMFGYKLHIMQLSEKTYAGIGYKYDQTRDAFIAPKPFNSWI
jgi:hypothetical protein